LISKQGRKRENLFKKRRERSPGNGGKKKLGGRGLTEKKALTKRRFCSREGDRHEKSLQGRRAVGKKGAEESEVRGYEKIPVFSSERGAMNGWLKAPWISLKGGKTFFRGGGDSRGREGK